MFNDGQKYEFKTENFKNVPRLDLKDVAKEGLEVQVGTHEDQGESL